MNNMNEYRTDHHYQTELWEHKIKTQKALAIRCLVDGYVSCTHSGGLLHVMLEDGNYHCVEGLLENCRQQKDIIGAIICELMREFNQEELEMICERGWEFVEHFENH